MERQAIEHHPASELFPLLEGARFRELVEDIKANGLQEPIVLLDGAILDGRNRYRACLEAGVQPRFREYDGLEPWAFVLSANLHRRHLTASQRAMVGGRYATLKHGGDRKSEEAKTPRGVLVGGLGPKEGEPLAIDEAAERVDVSPRSIDRAREVLKKGDPALVAAVEAGDIPVKVAAEAAALPKPKQRKVVKDVEAGEKPRKAVEKAKKPKHEPDAEATPGVAADALLDALGAPVPEPLATHWRQMLAWHKEANRLLADLGSLLSEMGSAPAGEVWGTALSSEDGPAGKDGEKAVRRRCAELKTVRARLRESMPYVAVCPYCVAEGKGRSHPDCTSCHGWGYVTKQVWSNAYPGYRAEACELVGGKEP